MGSAEIRDKFLDFFKSKAHVIVPSAPIVTKNDPTLLFTNAGMNQFKDYFLGNKKAPHPRVADTQKCLRVSGKHNDLEEVGVDTYHHTMFEMLGNWSFGDYFKKEAISWSWELLTRVYQIPVDRIYITVFGGDDAEQLAPDHESRTEWMKWVAADRILAGSKKDNFWEMGDTGPCGPCTEIHVDCRSDGERLGHDAKMLVNKDHPQVIEIWNNVFIEFNRSKSGVLEILPSKHVDTGMGLERLVRVLQNKQSNYDTDIFSGTLAAIAKITGRVYTGSDTGKKDIAFRVIADHIRAIGFTIADGQLPSNTGAGYVIRRILRRAVRYYYSYLGQKEPLLFQLVPLLATEFQQVFPGLKEQQAFVERVVREEEEAFLRTLDKGIKLFNEYIENGAAQKSESAWHAQKRISGVFAFKLNDTYGFPVDLTSLMAREIGWTVDEDDFEKELQKQKDRSRAAGQLDTGDWVTVHENGKVIFSGYTELNTDTEISRWRKARIRGKEIYQLVLAKTPFYAESGGQVGDTGMLTIAGEKINVLDTKKENDLIIHYTEKLPADQQATVFASVDREKRENTAVHHTATHLLHAALRRVLGTHVTQKGSLVNADHLRFDFSHFSKPGEKELEDIERMVNEKIRENIPVIIREMPREEALKSGAMALFGEKYGDTVRVVTIDPAYSIELCGGTHVAASGDLGYFKIKSESAVAAGVRRIEAVAGLAAENYISTELSVLSSVREQLKNPKDLIKAIQDLNSDSAGMRKRIESMEMKQAGHLKTELLYEPVSIGQYVFIGKICEGIGADTLRKLAGELRQEMPRLLLALAVLSDGKPFVVIGLGDHLVSDKNWDASKIVREIVAPLIRGGGGGQKTLATAGGQEGGALEAAIAAVKALL
ncbi:MAG TPA: alanine--tRNA ligase [Chitinophagaceae bacterium]|nr:alanine--tRNA ligase [Chitinophagaceae bacterium]